MKQIARLLILTMALILIATTALAALPENYVMRNGDRESKRISITVDDCFNPEVVRAMHELCVELDFPITWFVVGYDFMPEDKELWREILEFGSELGNHTWKHSCLPNHSLSNTEVQLRLTQERVDEVLGFHYPLRMLRPPYGEYKNEERNLLPYFYELGVEKVVLWDIDETDPQKAFKQTKNGSILLFHTNKKDLECLKVLIPMLKDAGYELVTASELLGMEPLDLESLMPATEPTVALN